MLNKIILYLLLLLPLSVMSQMMMGSDSNVIDIGGLEYELVPSVGENHIEKYGANFNFAKKINDKSSLGVGLSYNLYKFRLSEFEAGLSLDNFENMNSIRMNLFYRTNLKKNWSAMLMFSPSLMSNFKGELSSEDFIFNGIFSISKVWGNEEKNSRLTFGAGYGTMFGEPRVFPMLSFMKKINEKWSYALGFPITRLTYRINERNILSAMVRPEGYFGNNSAELYVQPGVRYTNTKIQYNAFKTGIEYRYRIQNNFTIVTNAGYMPVSNLTILDPELNDIHEFDTSGSPYINVNLKFNIDKKDVSKRIKKNENK